MSEVKPLLAKPTNFASRVLTPSAPPLSPVFPLLGDSRSLNTSYQSTAEVESGFNNANSYNSRIPHTEPTNRNTDLSYRRNNYVRTYQNADNSQQNNLYGDHYSDSSISYRNTRDDKYSKVVPRKVVGKVNIDKASGLPIQERGQTSTRTQVYPSRWYILLIFSLMTTLQSAVWASWGPIAQSAKAVYGWQNSTVATMINCGNIGGLVSLVFASYLVSKKGLRITMVLCAFTLALGAGLRVITMEPTVATILIGAGQFFNGVAGGITAVVPSVISEVWFPSNERTTATAIGVLSNALGGAAAFVLGPNIVEQPPSNISDTNVTSSNITDAGLDHISHEIWLLNMIEFSWGGALFLIVLVYFPAKPPSPPSKSASVGRPDFVQGFKQLIFQPRIWQIVVTCTIPIAVYGNWLGMLDVNLHDDGVTQTEAGWYGFYASAAGVIGGTVLGRMADVLPRRMKSILLCLYITALMCIVWITSMCNGYIPRSNAMFIVSITLIGVLMMGTMPLMYEITCESAYPIAEEISGLFIGVGKNLTAVIFMLIQLIPNVGTKWMNWCLVGVLVTSATSMMTYRVTYNRTDIDTDWSQQHKQQQQHQQETKQLNVNAT